MFADSSGKDELRDEVVERDVRVEVMLEEENVARMLVDAVVDTARGAGYAGTRPSLSADNMEESCERGYPSTVALPAKSSHR